MSSHEGQGWPPWTCVPICFPKALTCRAAAGVAERRFLAITFGPALLYISQWSWLNSCCGCKGGGWGTVSSEAVRVTYRCLPLQHWCMPAVCLGLLATTLSGGQDPGPGPRRRGRQVTTALLTCCPAPGLGGYASANRLNPFHPSSMSTGVHASAYMLVFAHDNRAQLALYGGRLPKTLSGSSVHALWLG